MSARRDHSLQTLLPPLEIIGLARPVDLRTTFACPEVIIDFGSGMGDHSLALASSRADLGVLAIDVHTVGLCEVAQFGFDKNLANIRVHHGDGINVLKGWLVQGSISEVHILFPDPWPKIRHHKRRLIQQDFLNLVANVLAPNGVVRFVTDDDSYFEHASLEFETNSNFQVLQESWEVPVTTYHKRALRLGHTISCRSFKKLNPS